MPAAETEDLASRQLLMANFGAEFRKQGWATRDLFLNHEGQVLAHDANLLDRFRDAERFGPQVAAIWSLGREGLQLAPRRTVGVARQARLRRQHPGNWTHHSSKSILFKHFHVMDIAVF